MNQLAINAALMGAATFTTLLTAPPALADEEGCLPGVGEDVPVMMIHGLYSDKGVWYEEDDDASHEQTEELMYGVLTEIRGVYLQEPDNEQNYFDYSGENLQWVDHPNIGDRLVREINCRAASSRAEGGPGKVILIGHSMGGLAIRYAANNGAADNIGAVITIGTPNEGSGIAEFFSPGGIPCDSDFLQRNALHIIDPDMKACDWMASALPFLEAVHGLRRDSWKLDRLGWVPEEIPVTAIAGRVEQKFWMLGEKILFTHSGDLVVSVESALHGSSQREVLCSGYRTAIPNWSDASCAHTNMLKDEQVQQHTVDAIEDYLASLRGQQVTIHGMTLTIPHEWTTISEDWIWQQPGDTLVGDAYCVTQEWTERCGNNFAVYGPETINDLYQGYGGYDPSRTLFQNSGGIILCRGTEMWQFDGKLVDSGTRQVGNKQAAYYEYEVHCGGSPSSMPPAPGDTPEKTFTHRIWHVEELDILIVDEWNTDGLEEILSNATF